MKLHKTQKEVAKDDTRFRVVCCGRGWGKTTLAIEELIGVAISGDDKKVVYMAPTNGQARDIAWERLKKRVEPIADSFNESRLEAEVTTQDGGTSTIYLHGWESVERTRGIEYDFIVLDEVAEMGKFWSGWQDALRPTLRMSQGGALFISTPKGYNHFYDLFNKEAKNDNYRNFHYKSKDNPFLPEEEIKQAKKELPADSFAQEWEAEFKKVEGLVYKEFDRDQHVVTDKELDKQAFHETLAGIDFGYTNPAVVLTIKVDNKGDYFITNEWYKRGKTDAEVADYTSGGDYNAVYPDPENAAGIEEMRQRGINVRDVNKSRRNMDRGLRGVDTVREMLKQGRLFVSDKCLDTISEFETYRYPDEKENRNDDERPKKENDHAMDALRYCLMTHSPTSHNDVRMQRIINQNRNRNRTFK